MRYLTVAHTDVGIRKKVNQDAFCLYTASSGPKKIVFAAVCDGMGGLKLGELASAFLLNAFSGWFEKVFPEGLKQGCDFGLISEQWGDIVQKQNELIRDYGSGQGVALGTTLTAMLICDGDFAAVHVGDSRLYRINKSIEQLTEDHSLVALEVKQGKLTPEQARTDRRGNVLLQCVGASPTVEPQFLTGKAEENDVFMLCSDGFRHKLTEDELLGVLAPELLNDERIMRKTVVDLINLNKSRGETDNITSVLIKCVE